MSFRLAPGPEKVTALVGFFLGQVSVYPGREKKDSTGDALPVGVLEPYGSSS